MAGCGLHAGVAGGLVAWLFTAGVALASLLIGSPLGAILPLSNPLLLTTLLDAVQRPSPYRPMEPGLTHLAYLAGLGVLSAVVALKRCPAASGRHAALAGLVASGMNVLAALPVALQASLTGLFLLVPSGLASMAVVALSAWLTFSATRRGAAQ